MRRVRRGLRHQTREAAAHAIPIGAKRGARERQLARGCDAEGFVSRCRFLEPLRGTEALTIDKRPASSLTRSRRLSYGAQPLDVREPMDLENLKLLETKINQFVDQHERVRDEHQALLQRLKEKDKLLAEAQAQVKQLEQERSDIRTRLERILSRLEGLDLT